jgi:hypothetical protein
MVRLRLSLNLCFGVCFRAHFGSGNFGCLLRYHLLNRSLNNCVITRLRNMRKFTKIYLPFAC